VVLYR